MEKRKVEDIYEIGGRKFVLKKFDPMLGNYILLQLFTMTLPFGLSAKINQALAADGKIGDSGSHMMSKDEFMNLQKDILSHVYERLEGRDAPLINNNGSYGVSNITMGIIFQLLVAEIAFNFMDFFGDLGLSNIFTSLSDTNLQNTPQ